MARCPHGTDHNLRCTNSNEPGQEGSRYGNHHTPKAKTNKVKEYEFSPNWLTGQMGTRSITVSRYSGNTTSYQFDSTNTINHGSVDVDCDDDELWERAKALVDSHFI